jgi:dTDP-4-dehydrorhamnose reductase
VSAGELDVWVGIECSYTRVRDRYVDQIELAGLYQQPEIIDRLAELGVTAMRVPVLWERRVALGERGWEWPDAVIARLRDRGIMPIVGLMHHGSGPPGMRLDEHAYVDALAEYAAEVAARYPWVTHYTPINEPLTTARFATLYGLWYPHVSCDRAFAKAVTGQARAISAAMHAIRGVTPEARLVQTEDLGRTYATAKLQYQADFENDRRWLTFDLLCGRVTGSHPMARYLRWAGVTDGALDALAESSVPPDIVGVNHYLTSERFLDHRVECYPTHTHGGNHRDRYVDVEAVRVLGTGVAGPYVLLRETWERYGIPIAVTEAHLGCTREQQLRWLAEVWDGAAQLRTEGADIRAVTAWSAFGAFDWSSLLTRQDGAYEPGLFDVRAPRPRLTALGAMTRSLARGKPFRHPVLQAPGWWRCERRLTYRPAAAKRPVQHITQPARSATRSGLRQPVLIVGASGTLGQAMARACEERGLAYVALNRAVLDATDAAAARDVLAALTPWCAINCAGFVRVDDAERETEACRAANVLGAVSLARACATYGVKFVTFSSDLVFDGAKRTPYVESDPVRPLCEYGNTKAAAEVMVLELDSQALVVRTAAFFGDDDDFNFVTQSVRALADGQTVTAANDLVVSPTYVPDLVNTVLDLAIDNESGVWHLANAGETTWEQLAREAAALGGVATSRLRGVPVEKLGLVARRPAYSALASERCTIMPSLDDALARYARARPWERHGG